MNATVNVVCYTSKILSNGEHPLMLRICKNGKKKYQSLEAVLISFDKFVKHDLDECNLYHSFCGFSKEFIIDGQPSEVFQP